MNNMWRKSVGKMFVWFCVLGVVSGELGGNMDRLSIHLQQDMADVLELAAVNYSEPVINVTYKASVEFDMRAMGPLYNSTHAVIDFIADKQAYPEGLVQTSERQIEVAPLREEWRPLLTHYAGPTAIVIVALLLAAILPLAGLFWCCCYWCRVGRRRRPFDRKYDACLKGFLAIILICLLTLFLFGVVCLFATDSQVESGARDAPESLRVGLRDARLFLNATQAHARWLLVVNYRELAERLNSVLIMSGTMVSMKLGEFSRAVSVTTLNRIVVRLDDVQADLRKVHNLTAALRINADHLNSGLRKVKKQLLDTLANCDQPKCIALQNKYKIGQLDTEIHYSQMLDKYFPTMPDVSDLLNNVTSLINSNIKEEVGAGQQVFRDISAGIRRSVQEHIPSVQTALEQTGKRLEQVANEITWRCGNLSLELERQEALGDTLEDLHSQYGPYRRYVGLAAATAPLLITCLMAWGLVCGVCGKRPDVYGASDCCNKGAGSRCLLCGIGMIFLLGGAMSLVLAGYFVAGVGLQRFICDPLTEPRDNRLFADLEKYVDLEKIMFNERRDAEFNIASVLVDCHSNHTIYKTLQLHRLYDLDAVRAEVSSTVSARVAALRPTFPHAGATILRDGAKRKLKQLAETGLSDFDFDRILQALETNMTSLALDSLARQLNSTAYSLLPSYVNERASLLAAANQLFAILTTTLQPMLEQTQQLNETAIRLRDELRFNHTSLKEAISYLMHEATEAESFLNTQGPQRLQNMTREFASVIELRLNEYMTRVDEGARHDVGRCGPLSNAYNATRDAACNKILMPTNGYWMSLAWCVVLFLPLLMVCQRLARLYLHLDPYPGPLVEAEYLYDAYADRDNVPLANAYKAEKRSGRRARDELAGRGSGGGPHAGGARAAAAGPAEALPPPLDAHHARRYNDMAPKHWEEGPPRYHGPTEYERPPPYYYPGPNDRP